MKQIERFESTDTAAPVAASAYGYDGMGRLTALDHTTASGATTLASYDYTYDAASRITSINSLIDGQTSYTYDVTNQLTGADHSTQPDESYSFDLNGNRTMTGHTVIANNRLSTDGTYNYEYDSEGNQTKRTKISDGSYEENTWDHRNRLTKVTFKNSGGTVTKTVEYAYDVYNRLVRRTYDSDGPGAASPTDQFFAFDGYNAVLQFDGTSASDLSNRNLFGPAVDQILAIEDVTSLGSAGNVLFGLGDHLGTQRDIVDRNESTGVTTVTNHRTYNSFGTQLSETNSSVDYIFGESGKLLDEITGSNWHVWRWLTDGQWKSEDPIVFGGGDTNLRRDVHNDPVRLIDLDGLHEGVPPPRRMPSLVELFPDGGRLPPIHSADSYPVDPWTGERIPPPRRRSHYDGPAIGPVSPETAAAMDEDQRRRKWIYDALGGKDNPEAHKVYDLTGNELDRVFAQMAAAARLREAEQKIAAAETLICVGIGSSAIARGGGRVGVAPYSPVRYAPPPEPMPGRYGPLQPGSKVGPIPIEPPLRPLDPPRVPIGERAPVQGPELSPGIRPPATGTRPSPGTQPNQPPEQIRGPQPLPEPVVRARGRIGNYVFDDVNQAARAGANPQEPTLIAGRVAARDAKSGRTTPNGNMADAHAEIGVIQQAHNAGVAKGAGMIMTVEGLPVCGYCRGDIAAMAEGAKLGWLVIIETSTGKIFVWEPGDRSIREPN